MENYGDKENIFVILMESGKVLVMSKAIYKIMLQYQKSVKQQAQEEEAPDENEEEMAK